MKPLFYSDYLEGAHPQIMDALLQSNMVQTPGYGTDSYCDQARARIKEACQAPQAEVHFLVGGTQANATVINSILKPYQGVLCAATGHIRVHETGAIEHGGHKCISLPHKDGKICAADITAAVEGHWADENHEHTVMPGMVYISNPTELGTIYTCSEMQEISDACHKSGIPLFVDGARLGYGLTCSANDIKLKDIAAMADVFYIGGTKQGALFGEAVVICNPALQKDFRYNIKQNGGMLAKGRLLGIQFLTLFTDDLYFRIARNANVQAEKIRECLLANGYKLFGNSPTNQVFVVVDDAALPMLGEKFGYEYWQRYDATSSVVRICTSWATSDENVQVVLDALSK